MIDPTDSLLKYKYKFDVYYSTDTHWNIFGAWVGYNYLLHEIAKDFPEVKPIDFEQLVITDSFNNRGDLSGMLSLENVYKRKEYDVRLKDTTMKLNFPATASIYMKYNENKVFGNSNLKMMMFRDSYANYLIPFMNLHFSQSTYVWSYDFLPDMIAEEQPDIVILEVQQRAMIYGLLNENFINESGKQ